MINPFAARTEAELQWGARFVQARAAAAAALTAVQGGGARLAQSPRP